MSVEIRAEIRDFIAGEFVPGGAAFDGETPLITGGLIDSIGMIRLVSFLEARFGVEFLPREVDVHNLDNLDRIERLVRGKLGASAGSSR